MRAVAQAEKRISEEIAQDVSVHEHEAGNDKAIIADVSRQSSVTR